MCTSNEGHKGDRGTIETALRICEYRELVKVEAKSRGVKPADQVTQEGTLRAYLVVLDMEGGASYKARLIECLGISGRQADRYIKALKYAGVLNGHNADAAADAPEGLTAISSQSPAADAPEGLTANRSQSPAQEVRLPIAVKIETASITSNNYSTVGGFQKFWAGAGLDAVMAADDYLARCRDAGMGEVDAQKLAENFIQDRYYDDPDWMGPALIKWIEHRKRRNSKKSVNNECGKESQDGKSGRNGAAGPTSQSSRGKSRGAYSHLFRGKYK